MKKVLMILAIAGFAVACNNSGEKTGETKDTTATTVEPTTTTPPADSSATTPGDSTATAPAKDSTAK